MFLTALKWLLYPIFIFTLSRLCRYYWRLNMMPPGPRGLPLLGNVFQVPKSFPWFQFTKWSEKYGHIYSLNLAGQPVVVLNTFRAANDLMERRSNIYSDRPRLIVGSETLTQGKFLAFARYGSLLRRMRRAAHDGFNQRAVQKYDRFQRREALHTTIRVLESPSTWELSVKRMAISSILSAVYDWDQTTDENTPVVQRIFSVTNKITRAAMPGAYLVEIIPALNYLPEWMTPWKKDAISWYKRETAMFESFNDEVAQKKITEGINPCFVDDMLESQKRHMLSKSEMAWLSGIMFIGGAETTTATMMYFYLAMTLYPEVKKKAQEELDRVIGRGRPPKIDDIANLPYNAAIVKETLRWKPPAPMAMTHVTTEDDWYEGYFIPKGCFVIANVWRINRDPTIWPDASEFRPERHLGDIPEGANPLGHSSFGFGRRICPGLHYANQNLGVIIPTMLWALQIEPELDDNGSPILPPREEYSDYGITVGPKPFQCRVHPRFPEARDILEAELKNQS